MVVHLISLHDGVSEPGVGELPAGREGVAGCVWAGQSSPGSLLIAPAGSFTLSSVMNPEVEENVSLCSVSHCAQLRT